MNELHPSMTFPRRLRRRRICVLAPVLVAAASLVARAEAEDDWRWGPGLGFSNPGSDFKVALTGYVQEDFRSYRDFEFTPAEETKQLDPTRETRRTRLGAEGEWKRFSVDFQSDLADDKEHIKNAYGELKLSPAFRVRGGKFKLPFSAEFLTSAAKTDFMERSMATSRLGTNRDWGGMIWGDIRKRLLYQAGVFRGDSRSNDPVTDVSISAKTTVAGRLVVTPVAGLDVGGSFTAADVEALPQVANSDSAPKARGDEGKGPSGYRFAVRHYVQGHRRRLGAEATWARGPLGMKAEYIQAREQRLGQSSRCQVSGAGFTCDDLPDVTGRGWTVSGTWLLTGDRKRRTIEPEHPLPRGPGAIELAVRYEELRFDDEGPDTGFEGVGARSSNIRPAGDRVFTGGVSWWPSKWTRLLGNVSVERYRDPLLSPVPGRRGNYVTLAGRLQVGLP